MSPLLAQRQIVLVGIALVAVLVALGLSSLDDDAGSTSDAERRSVQAPGTSWYTALAAPYRFPPEADRTACGQPTRPATLGVAHPVLPCGAKLVLEFDGTYVLTQVVDRGSGAPGREFDIVAPLARRLGLEGVQQIRWRFAAPGE